MLTLKEVNEIDGDLDHIEALTRAVNGLMLSPFADDFFDSESVCYVLQDIEGHTEKARAALDSLTKKIRHQARRAT